MKMPYLGRINLNWCEKCNVPVMGKRCGTCFSDTRPVSVSPPGDVRPAFQKDIDLINETVTGQYGTRLIPEDKIIILNKGSGFDRFDEVVMDGQVIGVLKFDIESVVYQFMPSVHGARMIYRHSRKKTITLKDGVEELVIKNKSVLLPGVEDFDHHIETGDEVLIISDGEAIAVGRAKFSGKDAIDRDKGMFAKVRKSDSNRDFKELAGGQTLNDMIKANTQIMENYEREAVNFIKSTASKHNLPMVVAFSGGKDSLATMLLVRKVVPEVEAVFIDTGLEFPETYDYVEQVSKEMGFKLHVAGGGEAFFKGLEYFGAPGKDYRWCCKVLKLGPNAKKMLSIYPEGFLAFVGQRRYESEVRAMSERIWKNPWLPVQTAASPIQNWTALHIWIYILKEGAMINPLYYEGMERLGCWACPGSDLTELNEAGELHPELMERFKKKLVEQGYSQDEIKLGFWRWKNLPTGISQEGERLGVEISAREPKKMTFNVIENEDNVSTEFQLDIFDFEVFKNFFSTVYHLDNEDGEIRVGGIEINSSGLVKINAQNKNEIIKKIKMIVDINERANHCFSCGVCLAQCKNGAVSFNESRAVFDSEACKSCGSCHNRCPIIKYAKWEVELMGGKGE